MYVSGAISFCQTICHSDRNKFAVDLQLAVLKEPCKWQVHAPAPILVIRGMHNIVQ